MLSADIAVLAPFFSRQLIESWHQEFDSLAQLHSSTQTTKIHAKLTQVRPLHADENYLTFVDSQWPGILNQVEPKISCIYYEGNLSLLGQDCILGVVGSRTVTAYGAKSLNLLTPLLANGLVTLSGLAYGIDTLVHQLALEHNAPTIAIIGGGLGSDTFYPKEHWSVRTKILEKSGLLLSEYPRGVKPLPYHFPLRNRLISALASKLFIIQASLKSGTLITAELALQLGKDILTLPAELDNPHFAGNIKLLQNGAVLVASSEDIAQFIGFSLKNTKSISNTDTPLLQMLGTSPQTTSSIAEHLGVPLSQVLIELTTLEISGLVRQDGQFWTRF